MTNSVGLAPWRSRSKVSRKNSRGANKAVKTPWPNSERTLMVLRSNLISTLLSMLLFLGALNAGMVLLAESVNSAPVTLAWDDNSEPDLGGYKLHFGQVSGNYATTIDVGKNTRYTIFDLHDDKTYYFAVTAYDKTGTMESGYSAEVSNAPWTAALVRAGEDSVNGKFCDGSLIHPQWVLTAAHCVIDKAPMAIDVVLGRHDLSNTLYGERIPVDEIAAHPDYHLFDADLALLKLSQPSSLTPIRTARAFSVLTDTRSPVTEIDWGNSGPTLRQSELIVASHEVCRRAFDDTELLTQGMLCAGFREVFEKACVTDSGGPLITKVGDTWKQVGITQFGADCAWPDYFGVYTKLADFDTFITDTVCTDAEIPAAPVLTLEISGNAVNARWSEISNATGYQVFFTPQPSAQPIRSIDFGPARQFSTTLPGGSAFFMFVVAYNGNCSLLGNHSNLVNFSIP